MPYASVVKTASIAASGSTSDDIYLSGNTLLAIEMPSAWTTSSIAILASSDGTTYNKVINTLGVALAITASINQYVTISPDITLGINYLKLQTSATQSSARIITLISRGIVQ